MLCVFFRHCVSGNPPPVFFFRSTVLGFLCEGFFGTNFLRGKCCAFFSGAVFREIPLIVLAFFSVLLVLGFLCGGFFGTNSRAGLGRGESWIFVWKMLQFCSKNPAAKSSLFVSLAFLEFSLSKGRRCTEFCGKNFGYLLVRF